MIISTQQLNFLSLLLAAHIILISAELSGDNLCHKRETYTVTMRVIVKEPIQVKSYTWCLKVPPRCTKYKTEMRDKLKIQTEIRERVVDVCCAGYAADLNETQCLPMCKMCLHGLCDTPNSCQCEPGYMGEHCDKECLEGKWGSSCEQNCQCYNNATCSHVTGDCKCSDGWRGSMCNVPCPRGTYGHECLKECNCHPTNNERNLSCHHVSGQCWTEEEFTELPMTMISTINSMTSTSPPTSLQSNNGGMDNENNEGSINTNMGNNDLDKSVTEALTTMENSVLKTEKQTHFSFDTFTLLTTISEALTTTESSVLKEEKQTHFSFDTFTMLTTTSDMTEQTPTILLSTITEETTKQISKDTFNNSLKIQPELEEANNETNGLYGIPNENNDLFKKETVLQSLDSEDTEHTTERIKTSETQSIDIHPRGILVVSDGLFSERQNDGSSADSTNSLWTLVFSASVAGGVALALIVMAAVTLLVSYCRNKKNMPISVNQEVTFRKHQLEKQPEVPVTLPQMYHCAENVSTLPFQHLFPDTKLKNPNSCLHDELQLHFGDVTTNSSAINGNPTFSYQSYNNMRACIELQYDIPPSSMCIKSNTIPPELESEHLYDEIPCWQNATTPGRSVDTHETFC